MTLVLGFGVEGIADRFDYFQCEGFRAQGPKLGPPKTLNPETLQALSPRP